MAGNRGLLVIFVTAGLGVALMASMGSCVPFSKNADATTPITPVAGYATVSQCPSFAAYQAEVDPNLQTLCMSCHGPGGAGAAEMQLTEGDSTDNSVAAANFYVVRNIAVPTAGSVDPNNPDGTSLLLEQLNGTLTHDLTLSMTSQAYGQIRDWVTQEVAQTCIINPTTGQVTVSASPTPGS